MCVARGLVTAACICDQVEPHGGDWNRFWFTLRASTHRAPLISTTPHGATRMAVRATVDTTRSHAGAPVRDGLRLINAYLHAARCHLRRDRNRRQHHCCKQQSDN
jgi:hypothetical protein